MRNIRNLDFNLLKAFNALYDECSVTRAAQQLSVTQPAMSSMLTRLRESFDDPLFVRVQWGIEPTNHAIHLAPMVKRAIAEIDLMLQPTHFEPENLDMTLTIATTDYGIQTIVVPFIAALKKQAPKVKVAVLPSQDRLFFNELEQGKIDLTLLPPTLIPDNFHYRTLFDEQLVCLMRADHPIANQPLTLDLFCELDFALVSFQSKQFRDAADDVLAKLERSRTVSVSLLGYDPLPNLLAHSDMVSIVPSRLVPLYHGMTAKPLPIEVQAFTAVMAWHARTHKDPAHQWLRQLLVESIPKL